MVWQDGNALMSRRLYREMYRGRRCPDRKTFFKVSIAAFVNMGVLHLMLPTGNGQDLLRLLK